MKATALLCTTAFLYLALATPGTAETRRRAGSPPSTAEVLEKAEAARHRITCSAGRFRIEIEQVAPQGARARPSLITGTWSLSGRRFREETVTHYPELTQQERYALETRPRDEPSPSPRAHGKVKQVVAFDGSEGAITTYQGGGPGAQEHLSGPESVNDALARCQYLDWTGLLPEGVSVDRSMRPFPTREDAPEFLGIERIAGVECLKLRAGNPRVPWQTTWWLAPRYGYLPMRTDEVNLRQGPGTPSGQYFLVRKQILKVKALPGDIFLPERVEKVVAFMKADGTRDRLHSLWHFTASDLRVNRPVDESALLPPDPASIASEIVQPGLGGCAYHALVGYAALLGVKLEPDDARDLAELYRSRGQVSLLDLATDLEALTGRHLVGYHASLEDLRELNRPVIAHVDLGGGNLHFVVIESLGAQFARVFDYGEMRVVRAEEVGIGFTGAVLTMEMEGPSGNAASLPRAACADSVLPETLAMSDDSYRFVVVNAGGAPLTLKEGRAFPEAFRVQAVVPASIAPGESAEVVVSVTAPRESEQPWALVVETNDPLRPTLWLGGAGVGGSQLAQERR